METLRSPLYEVADAFEANELFQRNGWTDGLPIVPPTDTIVGRFLEAAGLSPDAVVGIEPVRRRRITAEKVAIAAGDGRLPARIPAGGGGVREGHVRAGVRPARRARPAPGAARPSWWSTARSGAPSA